MSHTPKRHHQITAQDFFGANKVPTKDGQASKVKSFQTGFNLFNHAKKKAKESGTPVVFEKLYQTPPTWNSTIEETYTTLFPRSTYNVYGIGSVGGVGGGTPGIGSTTPLQLSASYLPSPLMATTPPGVSPQLPIMQGVPIASGVGAPGGGAPLPYGFLIPPQFHQFQPHQYQQYLQQQLPQQYQQQQYQQHYQQQQHQQHQQQYQQPHFPQVAAAPMWFIPPPQGFGMMNNPYQNATPGGHNHGHGHGHGHGQQTRRYK